MGTTGEYVETKEVRRDKPLSDINKLNLIAQASQIPDRVTENSSKEEIEALRGKLHAAIDGITK